MNKPIFAFLLACACSHFSIAEQVQSWFNGTTSAVSGGTWSNPLPEGVTVEDGRFVVGDPDTDFVFDVTEGTAPDTNVVTRIYSEVTFATDAQALPDLPDETKTAFCVTGGVYVAKVGANWVPLTGATPTDEQAKVLVEIDYRTTTPKARFAIMDDTTPQYLYQEGGAAGDWFNLGGTTPTGGLVTNVCYGGNGYVKTLASVVQLGVALYDNVKYPTVQEAVNAAVAAGSPAKVDVLRDNTDDVEIPKDSAVALETNGKDCGTIDNKSDVPVVVDVPAAIVEEGSGEQVIDISVSGKITVKTSDESKEVVSQQVDKNTVVATIATKDSVIQGQLTVAGKALTITSDLKTFLEDNSEHYMAAHTTGANVQADLQTVGDNGMTYAQSYVLGLDTDTKIVLQPATADTSEDNVMLATPNINVRDNYTVKYQAQSTTDGTTWTNVGGLVDTPQIPVGSGRYRVNTVIVDTTPAN